MGVPKIVELEAGQGGVCDLAIPIVRQGVRL
jgi:hypothetical protein